MAHVLPNFGLAALATLCSQGRAVAQDFVAKAISATSPGRQSPVVFIGVDSIYRARQCSWKDC